MVSIDALLLFLGTTFVVVLSPGPAVIAVSTKAVSNGVRRSGSVAMGTAIANTLYFILSATGISTLIVQSNFLFSAIKWMGVAYLLYLGLNLIFSKAGALQIRPSIPKKTPLHRLFLRGFILEMSNPKALLYFTALLPQFINPTHPVLPQFVIFGSIALCLELAVYSSYSVLAYRSTRSVIKPFIAKLINRAAGGMLVFAGLKMATVRR